MSGTAIAYAGGGFAVGTAHEIKYGPARVCEVTYAQSRICEVRYGAHLHLRVWFPDTSGSSAVQGAAALALRYPISLRAATRCPVLAWRMLRVCCAMFGTGLAYATRALCNVRYDHAGSRSTLRNQMQYHAVHVQFVPGTRLIAFDSGRRACEGHNGNREAACAGGGVK
eukprot:1394291-Rhodomonas_salina.5